MVTAIPAELMHDSTSLTIADNGGHNREHKKTGPGKPGPVIDQFIKLIVKS